MTEKPEFRLIKEYPNSKTLGSVFKYKPEWGMYSTAGVFRSNWTENYFKAWLGEYYEIYKPI